MGKLNRCFLNKQSGFSLIELSVVLGIVSVLAIGSTVLLSEQKVSVEHEVTEGKLDTVKTALLRFVEKNNYLPCPDVNTQGEAGFGIENRQLSQTASFAAVPATLGSPAQAKTASTPFIPAIPAIPAQPSRTETVDTCTASTGTVPFEMINLSLFDVMDAEQNLFHYAVNSGVSFASNMANCPVDSACFFNRNEAPAFDYTTEPVAGSLGVNNLSVCTKDNCIGKNLLSNGVVVLVLAYSKNASNSVSALSPEEQENRNNDNTFVKAPYNREKGEAYFDDLLISISGSELKRADMKVFQKNSVANIAGGYSISGNDVLGMGDSMVGASGSNIGSDPATWDRVNQVFDFGVAAANKEVVLTYDTYTVGAWDQPSSGSGTMGGMMGGIDNTTADRGTVTSNDGAPVKVYDYDHTDNDFDGVVLVSFVAGGSPGETYTLSDIYDVNGNNISLEVTEGLTYEVYQPYWNDSAEITLTTDENGQIDLEFAVGTTATTETIDFTNIELVYYNTPPAVPNFPSVNSISGIDQTEGL